jgi:hypothetical protein
MKALLILAAFAISSGCATTKYESTSELNARSGETPSDRALVGNRDHSIYVPTEASEIKPRPPTVVKVWVRPARSRDKVVEEHWMHVQVDNGLALGK